MKNMAFVIWALGWPALTALTQKIENPSTSYAIFWLLIWLIVGIFTYEPTFKIIIRKKDGDVIEMLHAPNIIINKKGNEDDDS